MTAAIRIHELRVRLGGRPVVDRVSFTLEPGEARALVGPNGSGKTTVLRAVLGLVPYEGTVAILGRDARREPIAARAAIGYVPQRPSFGDATALEALVLIARLRRLPASRARELLALVDLAEHAEARAATFSGGMQQRLSLAVAMMGDPAVLLLDEPSASLDRAARGRFLETVQRLRVDGHTLLIASHRDDEIVGLTDGVIHLEDGRLTTPRHAASNVLPLFRRGASA